jgi:hypothetical protein
MLTVLAVISGLVVCWFAIKGFVAWRDERRRAKEQKRRRRIEQELADSWGMRLYSDGYLVKMRDVNNSENDGSDEWASVWALDSFGYSDEFLAAIESSDPSIFESEDEDEVDEVDPVLD